MNKFYAVKVLLKTVEDVGNGKEKVKKWSEVYLCNAVSCTDAEAIVTKDFQGSVIEWEIKGVNESNIVKVL